MADFNLWHQDAGDMYDDEYGCYQWFKDKIFESNSQQSSGKFIDGLFVKFYFCYELEHFILYCHGSYLC